MTFYQPDGAILYLLFKEVIVRYKFAVSLGLLVLLILGSIFLPARFSHPVKATGQFAPMDVGEVQKHLDRAYREQLY